MSPVTTPMVTRLASTSSSVVLPACENVSRSTPLDMQDKSETHSRHSHQRRQTSGFDPAIDIVKDLPILAATFDGVGDILPVQDRSLLDHVGCYCDVLLFHVLALAACLTFLVGHRIAFLLLPESSALEDKDLALRACSCHDFAHKQVSHAKSDGESNKDAKITPFVIVDVAKSHANVLCAVDKVLARACTFDGACRGALRNIGIGRSHWNGLIARELAANELVQHGTFETCGFDVSMMSPVQCVWLIPILTIERRVEVSDPGSPAEPEIR